MKSLRALICTCCVLILSCTKKDYKPNLVSVISGRAYDSVNQEPYQGLNLRVGEYREVFNFDNGGGNYFVGFRDSAVTDANGYYTIRFTTSGGGNNYMLQLGSINKKNIVRISYGNKTVSFPEYYSKVAIPINKIGGDNQTNFTVIRQYYMQSRVTFSGNANQPLFVSTGPTYNPYLSGTARIYGTSNDTVLNIPILKNTTGLVVLFYTVNFATNAQPENPFLYLNNITIDKDTITGPAYTVFPATFK